MINVKSFISKTTCDRQKFFHIRTEGTQIYSYTKFQEIIFIRAKVKLCQKSLMKMELSIKWTCR
jgi:hypothetical protein